MRTTPLASLLALLLLSAPLAAQQGRYRLEGVSGVGSYAGRALVVRRPGGELRLTLRRDDGLRAHGALLPEASAAPGTSAVAFQFQAALPAGGGVTGALEGDAAPPRTYRARYLRLGGRLLGAWQVVEQGPAGEVIVSAGRETLAPRQEAAGRLRLAVSVDWEGRELRADDLAAMQRLREALPGVPLTHFLNAAYYTKPGADAAAVTSKLRGAVLPGDEVGLHVHGWRSLFAAAGVAFRDRPTFWGGGQPAQAGGLDMGHEVEIGAYTVDELRAVLRRSRALLGTHGFPVGASFRAGGWMATPNVLEAIRHEGFTVDSSATDGRWHDELAGYALRQRIPEVWAGVTEESQPYLIETPAGAVLEMPDTCALADYVTAAEMVDHVRRAAARLTPGRDLFVHVGFHQETAARYAARVGEALRTLAEDPDLPLVVETLERSASAAASRD